MTENNIWLRRRRSPRSEVELDAWVTERDAWLAERAKEVGSDLERIRATNVCEERSRKRATTIPPPEDEKEGARGTVRSACVAAQQRFLRSSGNPIHIWEAIWMCTNPAVAPMPLPDWCIAYLHKAAEGLLQASGDGEKLAIFIAGTLKFTAPGRNAVKARASDTRAISAALLYDAHRSEGIGSTDAYEMVRASEGLADSSSAKKLVRRGKNMLAYIPRPEE